MGRKSKEQGELPFFEGEIERKGDFPGVGKFRRVNRIIKEANNKWDYVHLNRPI